ncbi:MAG: sigma-70 family RNA polymerase sigma factor [Candidatus Omnitrophica bacterium]|nr:sigma-70 family RNA polymerase sigma factor [Candidatus Omnitrophota bacterium]
MDRREEFEEIVKRETNGVFNLAYRLCGNYHQAKDITQETFLRAYQAFDRFEGRSKIFTYLYRITCNVWKNSLRRGKIQNFTSYSAGLNVMQIEDVPEAENVSPEESLRKDAKSRIVNECLSSLAPGDRAIIILRDMEGRPYEEIAGILNCRTGTVKSRLARARQKLSEKILPFREELNK